MTFSYNIDRRRKRSVQRNSDLDAQRLHVRLGAFRFALVEAAQDAVAAGDFFPSVRRKLLSHLLEHPLVDKGVLIRTRNVARVEALDVGPIDALHKQHAKLSRRKLCTATFIDWLQLIPSIAKIVGNSPLFDAAESSTFVCDTCCILACLFFCSIVCALARSARSTIT